jgi:hypothetical protein
MKRSAIDKKMARCQAIIDRPTTSDTERDAAARAMKRLAALRAVAEPARPAWEPNWQGTKYQDTKHIFGMALINKLIRADIKLARQLGRIKADPGAVAIADPVGEAPEQIKITVKSPHYGSITVTVRNIPQDWGYCPRPNGIGTGMHDGPSDDLVRLGIALRAMANEYNYDNSDSMVDHFDTRYYLSVQDEHGVSIDRDFYLSQSARWAS